MIVMVIIMKVDNDDCDGNYDDDNNGDGML